MAPRVALLAAQPAVVLAVVLAAVLLASCTPATSARPAHPLRSGLRAASAPSGHLTPVWTSRGVRPVTAVSVVDDVALVYGSAAGRLYLFALDATSGRRLWRRAASTSTTTPGVALDVAVVGSDVAYFGPMTAAGAARLILAAARTGRTLARSAPHTWAAPPSPCSDDAAAPCASADAPDGVSELRLDPRTGRLIPHAGGFRTLAPELVDPLERHPEYLEHQVDRGTGWEREVSDLFDPGYSTDDGWDFERFGAYYVGTLMHYPPGPAVRPSVTIDLARAPLTASFSVETGQLWWQEHGMSINCQGALALAVEHPDPVRCRYSGSITYKLDASKHVVTLATNLHVTVEGFEPLSSKATWSHAVGAALSLVDGSGPLVAVTDHEALLRLPAGDSVLNLTTGALRPVRAGETFWCQRQQPFAQFPSVGLPHEGRVTSVCDAAGRPATRLPSAVPSTVSAKGPGGLRLVSTPAGVLAYRG